MTDCPEDVRLYFKCSGCGHVHEGQKPPERCPSCEQKCTFTNVTCYTPDCGCKGPDPKLLK
jgi:rubrerythrin